MLGYEHEVRLHTKVKDILVTAVLVLCIVWLSLPISLLLHSIRIETKSVVNALTPVASTPILEQTESMVYKEVSQ